jgi:HSP20 family molecular chaperone IbpA
VIQQLARIANSKKNNYIGYGSIKFIKLKKTLNRSLRVHTSRAVRAAKINGRNYSGWSIYSEECPMKGNRGFGAGGPMDLGTVFDEIFEAARDFHNELRKNFHGDAFCGKHGDSWSFNENTDYYPNYSYPPMNVFMSNDRSLTFEFAIAGFEEKDINLSFQGDYMVFSALIPKAAQEGIPSTEEGLRYFKRRLKMKDIEKQKYFVPLDKYAQENVKAIYRNGILKVSIPPKDEPNQSDGIKIDIISEN